MKTKNQENISLLACKDVAPLFAGIHTIKHSKSALTDQFSIR